MNDPNIGPSGLALRIAGALALVLLTFNPSGYSYYHWALTDLSSFSALKAVPGAVLLGGWVLYCRAAYRSLGLLGFGILSLIFASLVWLVSDWGIVRAGSRTALPWTALIVLALILGIGLSWSAVRRRVTGQVDTDETPG
jgi:hypothetical protein